MDGWTARRGTVGATSLAARGSALADRGAADVVQFEERPGQRRQATARAPRLRTVRLDGIRTLADGDLAITMGAGRLSLLALQRG